MGRISSERAKGKFFAYGYDGSGPVNALGSYKLKEVTAQDAALDHLRDVHEAIGCAGTAPKAPRKRRAAAPKTKAKAVPAWAKGQDLSTIRVRQRSR